MLSSFSLVLLSAFALSGHYAHLMVNPTGVTGFFTRQFTVWGAHFERKATVDLDALSLCSPNGNFLLEAKAFRDQSSEFATFYESGRRVLRIVSVQNDGRTIEFETGTGFLLGNGYFMTARHVLPLDRDYTNAEIAIEVVAEGRTPTTRCNNIPFGCSGFFNTRGVQFVMSGTNAVRDWAIYRFRGGDIAKFSSRGGSGLQLDMNLQPADTNTYSFHHVKGVGKKGNAEAGPAGSSTPARILTNTNSIQNGGSTASLYLIWMDLESGASGGPIFHRQTHRVIGVIKGATFESGRRVCDPATDQGPIATRTSDIYAQMEQHDVQRSVGLTDADIDAIRGTIFV